ncbi:hypothetical protein MOQ72_38290 [Saccharopolyspora sp. K220]|nr:hypothetical protein [Saccharopolyspora soli]MCI2423285.1 hypothetical protein [Saccharopolyspora soli]
MTTSRQITFFPPELPEYPSHTDKSSGDAGTTIAYIRATTWEIASHRAHQ